MADPNSHIPEESDSENNLDNSFHNPDYLTDPQATETAFNEIVSELLDLSTDMSAEGTSLTDKTEDRFYFPAAPWVDDSPWGNSAIRAGAESSSPTTSKGPRDWADDQSTLDQFDAFVPPNPEFELSRDPARNLGWFLTSFALLGVVLSYLFTGKAHQLTFAILGVLFIAGLGLLVWRMPQNRDHDSEGGAQV